MIHQTTYGIKKLAMVNLQCVMVILFEWMRESVDRTLIERASMYKRR